MLPVMLEVPYESSRSPALLVQLRVLGEFLPLVIKFLQLVLDHTHLLKGGTQ